MSKKKQIIIVVLGIAVLIVGLLLKRAAQKLQPIRPTGELHLVSTTPSPGKATFFNPTVGIMFTFDAPPATSSARISVSPNIQTRIEKARTNPNTILIRPKAAWRSNVPYRIVISEGLLSEDNTKVLKEKVEYEIEFESPPQDVIQMPPPDPITP